MRKYGGMTLDEIERAPEKIAMLRLQVAARNLVARVRELEGLVKETLWSAGVALAAEDMRAMLPVIEKIDAALAEEQ